MKGSVAATSLKCASMDSAVGGCTGVSDPALAEPDEDPGKAPCTAKSSDA